MLLTFTEVVSSSPVAVNPEYVVAVFTAKEGDYVGKTVICVINGSVVVAEDYLEVVGTITANLK